MIGNFAKRPGEWRPWRVFLLGLLFLSGVTGYRIQASQFNTTTACLTHVLHA